MQASSPHLLMSRETETLEAQATREGTNLHRRVSQWSSTRLGGVYENNAEDFFVIGVFLFFVIINFKKHLTIT
jgi:hypothetical protein